jgi:hypothetical protein
VSHPRRFETLEFRGVRTALGTPPALHIAPTWDELVTGEPKKRCFLTTEQAAAEELNVSSN